MPSTPSRQHYERLWALRREHRKELKVRLEDRRAALTPVHAGEVNDFEALCDTSSSAGVWAAIVEITSRKLQDVERALGRLQSGTYGRCSDCGAEVSASDALRREMPGLPGAGRRRPKRARRVSSPIRPRLACFRPPFVLSQPERRWWIPAWRGGVGNARGRRRGVEFRLWLAWHALCISRAMRPDGDDKELAAALS
jgi:RNA polymerase-binding transcription factor DksA